MRHQGKMTLAGLAAGVAYGLLARLAFGFDWKVGGRDVLDVMAVSFLFLVPLALGFVTVFVGERQGGRWSWWKWLIFPWLAALTALAGALALAWEGLICIFLWLPLVLVCSSVGGLCAGLAGMFIRSRRARGAVLAGCLVLPFVAAPIESRLDSPLDLRTVETRIEIAAGPEKVWREIERVPAIREREHRLALSHLIGFPRPVEAKLIGEGTGAVRHATFEHGVLFVETITRWEPGKALAFSIKADMDDIPPTTLDQHVTVGGPYFDVLEGEYRIEPLGQDRVMLHLSSRHRLSTRFNGYAGLWTDFIMRDTQQYILEIIRDRCEGPA